MISRPYYWLGNSDLKGLPPSIGALVVFAPCYVLVMKCGVTFATSNALYLTCGLLLALRSTKLGPLVEDL